MDNTCKSCVNDGVSCSVTACVHHSVGNHCTAPVISVSNDRATEKEETCCSTFRCKQGCCK